MRSRYLFSVLTPLLAPLLATAGDPPLEVAAKLDQAVGNVTFTPGGRMIFSHHPFFEPKVRVAELLKDGTVKAFPNDKWNDPKSPDNQRLDNVLGLRGDKNGVVWLLDAAGRTSKLPKIVAWDTKGDKLARLIYLPPPVVTEHSFLNDLAVDLQHQFIYIADEGIGNGGDGSQAALVVVDLGTGQARRLLVGHKSTLPEDLPLTVGGKKLQVKGKDGQPRDLRIGADGIVTDHAEEWLYFGPLSGTSLYRVRTAALRDESLSKEQLEAAVERYSDKPINGGLSIDGKGNVYLTAVGENAVGVITPDRKYRVLASGRDLLWPDGVSHGPDGFLYVSAAQVHLAAPFTGGTGKNKPPYLIFRLKPLAKGEIGK